LLLSTISSAEAHSPGDHLSRQSTITPWASAALPNVSAPSRSHFCHWCLPTSDVRLNDVPLATNLKCLCRASPPDAHSQLAGPAVGEQVCRGCADSLNAWAAAPLGGEGLVGLRQLPAPQPVHVGQRSGRRTAQACKKARETSHSTKTSQRTVNPGAGVPAMHEPASLRGQQQWGELVTVMRCKLKVGSQQRSLVL
jgi:hypothetical protein